MSADDWKPKCSQQMLHARARLRRTLRQFFDERGYLEVDTPLLSHDIVVDAHLDPMTSIVCGETLFLQTSPEAAMKRLLAAGSGNIYQVTHSFRDGERGARHNPEFTIVEWYGIGLTLEQQMEFTETLVRQAASVLNGPRLPETRFRVTTYQQAFQKYAGIDPLLESSDDLLNGLLAEHVEPHLGKDGPEFLVNYPASQAALARRSVDDPRVAERFELYVDGIELCNGYRELSDADELRDRERNENRRRSDRGANPLPGAKRMLAAMDHGLPDCSGVALGFDRLLMWLTKMDCIDDVLPFSINRS